ncbi:MAG TPA: hypothetical protein VNR38_00965 [Ureibacillus sp.]|nr:hypothetical protein [Ureibacillus sp.]
MQSKINEKAIELVNKFMQPIDQLGSYPMCYETAKQCALIHVDGIIEQWEYIDTYLADAQGELNPNLRYWQDVKQEVIGSIHTTHDKGK